MLNGAELPVKKPHQEIDEASFACGFMQDTFVLQEDTPNSDKLFVKEAHLYTKFIKLC